MNYSPPSKIRLVLLGGNNEPREWFKLLPIVSYDFDDICFKENLCFFELCHHCILLLSFSGVVSEKNRRKPSSCEFSFNFFNGFIFDKWFLGFETTSFQILFEHISTFYGLILFPS